MASAAGETESSSTSMTTTTTLHVAVGSKNPVKLQAVRNALERVVQQASQDRPDASPVEFQIHGFDVPSGVPDQPMGDEETQLGAKNRAEAAYEAFCQHAVSTTQKAGDKRSPRRPHLAIGLEGGLEWSHSILDAQDAPTLWCMAWMAIVGRRSTILAESLASSASQYYAADKHQICGLSKTATFLLPSAITKLVVDDQMELGHADDKVFGHTNNKQKGGTVGVLTSGIINRSDYYEQALVLALIPWIRPDVFSAAASSKEETTTDDDDEKDNGGSSSSSLLGSLFCVKKKR